MSDTGQLVTRLLGRMKILHRDGVIEFEIRNPREVTKRGTNLILKIEGLGKIPFLDGGRTIQVDANEAKVSFHPIDDGNGR